MGNSATPHPISQNQKSAPGSFLIEGGHPLRGSIPVSTSKNSTLALMGASLLIPGSVRLKNVPDILDIHMMADVLQAVGATVLMENRDLLIQMNQKRRKPEDLNYRVSRRLRASILVLGPLIGRFGQAVVSRPGGCAIGTRPIDYHLKGLQQLGAEIQEKHGYIYARVPGLLKGARIHLEFPSVGATENLIMAGVLAEGQTVIENAAQEPEIRDLCDFLNRAGARIQGAGTSLVQIEGVTQLNPLEYQPIPDRIEAGTYLIAGAITAGDVFLQGARADHLSAVLEKLSEAGCLIQIAPPPQPGIHLSRTGSVKPLHIKTLSYPGFPTDIQPPMMSLLSLAEGKSTIVESVFERRFTQVDELARMGARIKVERDTAVIDGVPALTGAAVEAPDIRAGASLILAALAASGTSQIHGLPHIQRGYENMEEKLASLGARISHLP